MDTRKCRSWSWKLINVGRLMLVPILLCLALPGRPEGPKETPATTPTPETEEIPNHGILQNFEVVGHNPLLDGDRGTFRDAAFDAYINPPLGIPRGSNGDITAAGDCVYVGSFV